MKAVVSHRWSAPALLALVTVSALAGCARSDRSASSRPTQAALGTAIPSVASLGTAEEREANRQRLASERAPSMRLENGALAVQSDDDHQGATGSRLASGWAVTWGDRAHQRAFMLVTDEQGAVRAAPAMVRQAVSEEEEIYPPHVVATAGGYAMAWTDPSNGRVRFARLDAARRPVGRASIVHDGLESPRAARLASHAHQHAVAVQMDRGVYFARLSPDGTRVGEGHLLAEDVAVSALVHLRASAAGFEVSWRESDGAVRSATVSHSGHVATRTVSDPSRVAAR